MADTAEKNIIETELAPLMKKKFLEYAEETIVSRAIPKVQDGLKPVQRYILYAMGEMGLKSNVLHRKCAKVAGVVIGEYNPHGDTSAYDALVGLAQPWTKRYPLVDLHGNCGSPDGDGPAAMRYTECRLSKIGESMLEGIDKDAVSMVPNYDNTTKEPVFLPGLFPCMIANGAAGIATGMASRMAPHYAPDVFRAIRYVLNSLKEGVKPEQEEVIRLIKAPDFPTGGIIINPDEVQEGYRTGRGRVILRGCYEIEEDKKGIQKIVLTEFPYNIHKSDVVARIGQLAFDDTSDDARVMRDSIADVIDESGKGNTRVVIRLKKGANPDLVVNNLYTQTGFQSSFTFNNTLLVNGRPVENVSLLKLVEAYCATQMKVKARVTKFNMDAYAHRLEIVNGFIKVNEDIDAVVRCIRASADHAAVIGNLMNEFGFTEVQARAIDARRLGSLNQLDAEGLVNEAGELKAKIAACKEILSDKKALIDALLADIDAYTARGYFKGDKRRTRIEAVSANLENRDLIEEQQIVMGVTHNYMLKAVKADDYGAQHRNGVGQNFKIRKGDFVEKLLYMSNHDDLIITTDKGRAYVLPAYRVPIVSRAAMGKYLSNYVDLQEGENVVSILAAKHDDASKDLMFVSKQGYAKRITLEGMTIRRNGIKVCGIAEGDELVSVLLVDDSDRIICATHDGFAVNVPATEIPVIGRAARGNILIRFKDEKDFVIGTAAVNSSDSVIVLTDRGFGKRIQIADITAQQHRGGKGVYIHKPDSESGRVAALLRTVDDETAFIVTSTDMIIRIPTNSIREVKERTSRGVKVIRLNGDAIIQSAVIGPKEEEEETESK